MNPSLGKLLMLIGVGIVLFGAIIYFWGNKLGWIGNLPGDIRIERENFRFYFPITTMVLASLLISLILRIIGKAL